MTVFVLILSVIVLAVVALVVAAKYELWEKSPLPYDPLHAQNA